MADDEAETTGTPYPAEYGAADEIATATPDPGEPASSVAVGDEPRPATAPWMRRVALRARAITWASRRQRGLLLALLCVVILSLVAGAVGGRLTSHAQPATRRARPTVTLQPRPTASATPTPLVDLTSYVNPFVGTQPGGLSFGYGGGGGNTYPGAALPFGMVQWSPETYPGPTAADPGGYQYSDGAIRDFSMTHLNGAGCRILGDAPFMPTTLPITDAPANDPGRYSASFAHSDESASPGAYSVRLGTGIQVDLTATLRTGFARIQFPAGQPENLLVASGTDLGGVADAHAQVVNPTEIAGSVTSGHFCGYLQTAYTVYFAAEFSRPATGHGAWQGGGVAPGSNAANGSGSGLYLSFAPSGDPLLVKVGVSYVSGANALANLTAENPGWNFDATRAAAQTAWNALLNRVVVTGGTADEERTFYTALYHTLLQPNTFSDTNGQYIGLDNQTHVAAGYVQYANFSGWDVYRTQIPLIALLAPEETSDMMQSL
ncbi:MAG TPA: GH92 family glycosyl hydrolase, partial [Ktedonobacterales bacterium]|nr:GH92 family glycosyl hydrolase [Ktedonobacterales bacterium]